MMFIAERAMPRLMNAPMREEALFLLAASLMPMPDAAASAATPSRCRHATLLI